MTRDDRVQGLRPDQLQDIRSWLDTHDGSHAIGSGYQASIYLYRGTAGNFVIKEPRGALFRRKLGEASVRRESRIYKRLEGVPGVPRCFGILDDKCLILEYIPGGSLREVEHQIENKELFYSLLLRTLRSMHEAGVAHGDLKKKDNILVGPNQEPFVIDFGIAIQADESQRGRDGLMFRSVRQADYNAWIKHKYQRRLDNLSAEDAEIYRPMVLESVARAIRICWQKVTFRRLRKRRNAST